jgi:hypothetical protein
MPCTGGIGKDGEALVGGIPGDVICRSRVSFRIFLLPLL